MTVPAVGDSTIIAVASDDGVERHEADHMPVPGSDNGIRLPTPPFQDLTAPTPLAADPPPAARLAAFGAIAVGGVLGMLIGYGIGDLMTSDLVWSAAGAVFGAATGAIGVGVVANLTLRAMGEWREVEHPEQRTSDTAEGSAEPTPESDSATDR